MRIEFDKSFAADPGSAPATFRQQSRGLQLTTPAGLDVVVQVLHEVAAGATGLGEDGPPAKEPEQAAGVEPGAQTDLAVVGVDGGHGPRVSGGDHERGHPAGPGLRDTNELLHAAGLPAEYLTAGLDSHDLAPYRAAVDRMLSAHEPYPGMVLDGHWTVVAANAPCRALFGSSVAGSNFVRDGLTDPAHAEAIVNWSEHD